mgnify:CR=1 FL=1
MKVTVFRFLVCSAALAAVCFTAHAVRPTQLPPGGTKIRAPSPKDFFGSPSGYGSSTVARVNGPGFRYVRRMFSFKKNQSYNVSSGIKFTHPLRKGDVLLLRFWARCRAVDDETGRGIIVANIQQPGPPWEKSVRSGNSVGKQWEEFICSGAAHETRETWNRSFGAGTTGKGLKVGGVEIW